MAMALDSTAVMRSKLQEFELGHLEAKFIEKNMNTLAKMAFSSAYIPGVSDDAMFQRDILQQLLDLQDAEQVKLIPQVRRLFYEAYTLSAFHLRMQIERKGDEAPRQLDNVERTERRNQFLQSHGDRGPAYWEGDRKASDDLVDAYVHMWEARDVQYVPWSERTSQKFMRDHAPRKDKNRTMADFRLDDSNRLMAFSSPTRPEDPLHQGDHDFALKWDRMMERNAMAVEMAHVMSFKAHESIRFFLEAARTEDLADNRFLPVSWDQVLSAEREIWRQLGEKLGRDVRGRPGMPPPADALLQEIFASKRITQILANAMVVGGKGQGKKRPLEDTVKGPKQPQPTGEQATGSGAGLSKSAKKRARAKAKVEERISAAATAASGRGGGRGGGRSGGRGGGRGGKGDGRGRGGNKEGKVRRTNVPFQLVGHETANAAGEPLCWAFNLKQNPCAGVNPGGRCKHGHHLCCRKGCGFGAHAFLDCPHK